MKAFTQKYLLKHSNPVISMKYFLTAYFICILSFAAKTQSLSFQYKNTIPVTKNSASLPLPFAGGIEVPQFSEIDLNGDGIKDLVIFDRKGYRVSCYLNGGTPNKIDYTPAPQYVASFPKDLFEWVYMIDYNGDGKEDLFTAAPGGVRVYKNVSDTSLRFQLVKKEVIADYGSFKTRLYVSQADFPSLLDIDGDGDLDILSFELGIDTAGDAMYWYKNISQEKYGIPDSLEYVVEKRCWGRFRESFTDCTVTLQYPVGICGAGGKNTKSFDMSQEEFEALIAEREASGERHAGSTTLIFDANGDGLYDLLIGDIGCNHMYLLTNTNTNVEPIMTSITQNYPPNNPIDIQTFPIAFNIDVNNDGKKDLIAVPNTSSNSYNLGNIHLYLNTSATDIPFFELFTDAFLEEGMIEVGECAAPHLFDYNNDGLLDLLIGNGSSWEVNTPNRVSSLSLYKNTGTATNPVFEWQSSDFSNLSALNINGIFPGTGDLDNDNDPDLLIGTRDGELHYFTNTALSGSNANFQLTTPNFHNIDIGSNSMPFLVDNNGDGKLDLIIAERSNNINYYIDSSATVGSPQFKLYSDSLGGIELRSYFGYPSGYAGIFIGDLYQSTGKDLAIANANGKAYFFERLDMTEPASYILKDSLQLNAGIFAGNNCGFGITMGDLDNDGDLDLIVGLPSGGLMYYENTAFVDGIAVQKQIPDNEFIIFPNPSQASINIRNKSNKYPMQKIEILNMFGQQVYFSNDKDIYHKQINLYDLQNGQYIVRIYTNDAIAVKKIVLMR